MHEIIPYNGWHNCLRLWNDEIDLIVATDIGPRILRYGYLHDQNFLHLTEADAGNTGGTTWRIYGGHRLWLAPEQMPGSYYPDNDPIAFDVSDDSVKLVQPTEISSGIVKEMEITLPATGSEITITHRITNNSNSPHMLSPWAITVLAPQGVAILPQEPFGQEDDFLLPARAISLWQYTQMNDPRWEWGNKFILARQDPAIKNAQKIGILNKQGWSAYALHGELFIKRFSYTNGEVYPDFNCNNELYFNEHFLEIESLAPAATLLPGATSEHVETWSLEKDFPSPEAVDFTERLTRLFPSSPII